MMFLVFISMAVAWRWSVRQSTSAFETVAVTRGTVVHEVSVTGKVEPSKNVSLAFASGGMVDHVFVAVGDRVHAGQPLVSLNTDVLMSQRDAARADVVREERSRVELASGARREDIAISRAALSAAQVTYDNAIDGLRRVIDRSYVVADDAVRNKADTLFENPTTNPSFGISFSRGATNYMISADNQTRITIADMRRSITSRFASRPVLGGRTADDVARAATQAQNDLEFVQRFLTMVAGAVNAYSADDADAQAVYATYQQNISTARNNTSLVLGELKTAMDAYASAVPARDVASRQLSLKEAGPTQDALAVQDAVIERAKRAVQTLQTQIDQAAIIAPIDGVITTVDVKRGEAVSPNIAVVNIMSPSSLQLTAYIPESDIVQVAVGDEASVTFDALDETDLSHARVAGIEDGETVREGVATYKTTLSFAALDPRIRSGMSADIDIVTDTRNNVLMLPRRSVLTENGKKFVRVPSSRTAYVEREVETGLRGSDGMIEIVHGVSEGENVVLYAEK